MRHRWRGIADPACGIRGGSCAPCHGEGAEQSVDQSAVSTRVDRNGLVYYLKIVVKQIEVGSCFVVICYAGDHLETDKGPEKVDKPDETSTTFKP